MWLQLVTKDLVITWLLHSCLSSDLDFADDFGTLADNTHDLPDLVNSISNHTGMLGFTINAKKTRNMLTGDHQPCTDILVNQQKAEYIEEFTYLGSSIYYQGHVDHELNCWIGKASVALRQHGKIWKNKKFSQRLKLYFYYSNVLSMLLNGCDTWNLKVSQEKGLDGFDSKCLQRILGIHWGDFVPNEKVSKWPRCSPVLSTICKWHLN